MQPAVRSFMKPALQSIMKRLMPPLITIGLSLLLALLSAALTYSSPSQAQVSAAEGHFFLQTPPAPQEEDRSEVGSTDKIVIMGGVIVFIVVAPILLKHRSWR